jgi:hypothetical protein
LAVVQIQDRIPLSRKPPVSRRQINDNVAPITQNPRRKCAVPFNVSGERVPWHERRKRNVLNRINKMNPDVPLQNLFMLILSILSFVPSMNERHIRWYTPWLNREFEILVSGMMAICR